MAAIAAFALGLLLDGFSVSLKPRVAEIPIRGTITPGSRFASPSALENSIQKAKGDGAKAFLFKINSPGGTVVASSRMEEIIKGLKKPTVCLFEDVAASGAYWAASACDHIVSHPLSMTGSIGVSSSYLEYSEYMKEEGIDYVRLVKGEMKDMGSPYRNLTEREKKFFNQSLEKVYNEFIEDVAENRNMNESEAEKLASGRSFLGTEAKEKGLVDYLGSKKKAKEILEARLGEEVELKKYENEANIWDILAGTEMKKGEKIEGKWSEYVHSLQGKVPYFFALAD